ncbi:uncharacterized protein LOC106154222 isoform X2 [Lingula anatina]|uniref:Uncharacterized protein LOC106154222 isoform X2 n=1 Tax=Lingula anatina TaxID=7574 RepID=A0A1S3HEN1_LINAN|nr:uncharacterized protein LOC106154222 isoform X2 [Lingula anatina]|eukprot:XP_013383966.1 uncharacterized protein LOC106154222 isoform X2 [Lingula anatina]
MERDVSCTDLESLAVTAIARVFEDSLLQPLAKCDFSVTKVIPLYNPHLLQQFRKKQMELQASGTSDSETYGYTWVDSEAQLYEIFTNGLVAKESNSNVLGSSRYGVHLSMHPDVCVAAASYETSGMSSPILIMFKLVLGKRNPVKPGMYVNMPPAVGFDSHVSAHSPSITEHPRLQHYHSQVYIYEYDDNNALVIRPRHCVPHAAIWFTRKIYPPHVFVQSDCLPSPHSVNFDPGCTLLAQSTMSAEQANQNAQLCIPTAKTGSLISETNSSSLAPFSHGQMASLKDTHSSSSLKEKTESTTDAHLSTSNCCLVDSTTLQSRDLKENLAAIEGANISASEVDFLTLNDLRTAIEDAAASTNAHSKITDYNASASKDEKSKQSKTITNQNVKIVHSSASKKGFTMPKSGHSSVIIEYVTVIKGSSAPKDEHFSTTKEHVGNTEHLLKEEQTPMPDKHVTNSGNIDVAGSKFHVQILKSTFPKDDEPKQSHITMSNTTNIKNGSFSPLKKQMVSVTVRGHAVDTKHSSMPKDEQSSTKKEYVANSGNLPKEEQPAGPDKHVTNLRDIDLATKYSPILKKTFPKDDESKKSHITMNKVTNIKKIYYSTLKEQVISVRDGVTSTFREHAVVTKHSLPKDEQSSTKKEFVANLENPPEDKQTAEPDKHVTDSTDVDFADSKYVSTLKKASLKNDVSKWSQVTETSVTSIRNGCSSPLKVGQHVAVTKNSSAPNDEHSLTIKENVASSENLPKEKQSAVSAEHFANAKDTHAANSKDPVPVSRKAQAKKHAHLPSIKWHFGNGVYQSTSKPQTVIPNCGAVYSSRLKIHGEAPKDVHVPVFTKDATNLEKAQDSASDKYVITKCGNSSVSEKLVTKAKDTILLSSTNSVASNRHAKVFNPMQKQLPRSNQHVAYNDGQVTHPQDSELLLPGKRNIISRDSSASKETASAPKKAQSSTFDRPVSMSKTAKDPSRLKPHVADSKNAQLSMSKPVASDSQDSKAWVATSMTSNAVDLGEHQNNITPVASSQSLDKRQGIPKVRGNVAASVESHLSKCNKDKYPHFDVGSSKNISKEELQEPSKCTFPEQTSQTSTSQASRIPELPEKKKQFLSEYDDYSIDEKHKTAWIAKHLESKIGEKLSMKGQSASLLKIPSKEVQSTENTQFTLSPSVPSVIKQFHAPFMFPPGPPEPALWWGWPLNCFNRQYGCCCQQCFAYTGPQNVQKDPRLQSNSKCSSWGLSASNEFQPHVISQDVTRRGEHSNKPKCIQQKLQTSGERNGKQSDDPLTKMKEGPKNRKRQNSSSDLLSKETPLPNKHAYFQGTLKDNNSSSKAMGDPITKDVSNIKERKLVQPNSHKSTLKKQLTTPCHRKTDVTFEIDSGKGSSVGFQLKDALPTSLKKETQNQQSLKPSSISCVLTEKPWHSDSQKYNMCSSKDMSLNKGLKHIPRNFQTLSGSSKKRHAQSWKVSRTRLESYFQTCSKTPCDTKSKDIVKSTLSDNKISTKEGHLSGIRMQKRLNAKQRISQQNNLHPTEVSPPKKPRNMSPCPLKSKFDYANTGAMVNNKRRIIQQNRFLSQEMTPPKKLRKLSDSCPCELNCYQLTAEPKAGTKVKLDSCRGLSTCNGSQSEGKMQNSSKLKSSQQVQFIDLTAESQPNDLSPALKCGGRSQLSDQRTENVAMTVQSSGGTFNIAPKRRGRPISSKNVKKSVEKTDQTSDNFDEAPKRRGRPVSSKKSRKNVDMTVQSSGNTFNKAPKRRGRPTSSQTVKKGKKDDEEAEYKEPLFKQRKNWTQSSIRRSGRQRIPTKHYQVEVTEKKKRRCRKHSNRNTSSCSCTIQQRVNCCKTPRVNLFDLAKFFKSVEGRTVLGQVLQEKCHVPNKTSDTKTHARCEKEKLVNQKCLTVTAIIEQGLGRGTRHELCDSRPLDTAQLPYWDGENVFLLSEVEVKEKSEASCPSNNSDSACKLEIADVFSLKDTALG